MKKTVITCIIFCLLSGSSFAGEVRLGATFSVVQCNYFGMSWQKTYEKVLDMGFDIIRLGAYWSEIEKEQGKYDFTDLDWQIKKAEEKGTEIVLTVGIKAPRWPEFYIPAWAEGKKTLRAGSDISKDPFIRESILKFITATVKRYKQTPSIKYWQVENEALNKIGPRSFYIGRAFLQDEAALVRMIDPDRQIIMTKSTYPNMLLRIFSRIFMYRNTVKKIVDLCDVVGLNVYTNVGHKVFNKEIIFTADKKERLSYFKKVISEIKKYKKTIWVTELQAEPWEPGHLVYTEEAEPKTVSVRQTKENYYELKQLGIETMFFWGVEYWIYRANTFQDNKWITMYYNIKKEGK